ncbi:MAG: NAD-binding protein [Burkholderiaceae bacterium]
MIAGAPQSGHGIFILLRRLRLPMIVLIVGYAVAVLGFTVIPGVDAQGQPWRMSFLHAFYFVSFLGTTIGLGEVPHPFTDAQRLWATASIYGTVLAWLYAIGALFAAMQDPMFRRVVQEGGTEREVRRLRLPFYLLCGYDDAGYRVARELAEDAAPFVVVDADSARVDGIDVEGLQVQVPALAGDASDPKVLERAGLTHPRCAGVLALTGDDFVNTKIVLTARLLAPELPIVCAAHDHGWHPRMAAAGADHIINPFDTFAERVALSLRTPSLHVMYEALTSQSGTAMDEAPRLPHGRWILCGSGLFTRALRRHLTALEIEVTLVDPQADDGGTDCACVREDPTDPAALRRAGIEEADAVVAGTGVDIDNLTITLAARGANKKVFIIARQTQRRNSSVFRASPADLVMLSGYVVAGEVLRVIRAPLLSNFLRRARDEDEAWAGALLKRLREVVADDVLESWSIAASREAAPSVHVCLARGEPVSLRRLMMQDDGSGDAIRAVPLMLQHGRDRHMLPSLDAQLEDGDAVLFCGSARARSVMRRLATAHALPPVAAAAAPDRARA